MGPAGSSWQQVQGPERGGSQSLASQCPWDLSTGQRINQNLARGTRNTKVYSGQPGCSGPGSQSKEAMDRPLTAAVCSVRPYVYPSSP